MSLSGNLEDVSVADAMQFIHLGARTGTLTLKSGETSAEIGFHQGKIVNAVGPGTKRLGDLLIENNVIAQGALDHALREQEAQVPRRSLGQVLLAMNVLTPETMYRAIEQQIERTVYDLVTWTHGTFHFALDDLKPIDDIALVPGDVIRHLNLDTQMVLLDALRIFDERNRDAGNTPAGGVPSVAPRPAMPVTPPPAMKSAPTPALGVPALPVDAVLEKVRLQVVSSDRQMVEKLAQAVPES